MVTFTLATAAPLESVTVPSKVAFTACPMTGAEYPRSMVPSSTAMLKCHRLIRAVRAGPPDRWALIAEDLSPRDEPRKDQLDSFLDRKSTRLNSSHSQISYAVFCLKK